VNPPEPSAGGDGRLGMIVAAGGHGVRLGAGGSKQYLPLLGVPMVQRTIGALDECSAVDVIVVVVNREDVDYCSSEIVAELYTKVVAVVGGGSERALSVRNGLKALSAAGATEFVGVHDGARPLITCADVQRVRDHLDARPDLAGALPALFSVDTLKRVDENGRIVETPPRGRFVRAQTPQVFRWAPFAAAYAQPDSVLVLSTDDSSLVEAAGGRVDVVEGSHENLKVTTVADVRVAESILAERHR